MVLRVAGGGGGGGGGNALTTNPLSQFASTTSAQLRGVISDETGTGQAVFNTSPALAGVPTAPTASQANNSTQLATTAYVDTLGDTKLTINAAASITGANTLVAATHFNRHLSWTGATTATQALSGTAIAGDYVECSNDGTAVITFTGVTAVWGYELQALPGECFQAVYTNNSWTSFKAIPAYTSDVNNQSAAYTFVASDAGQTIYHPSADTTARTWTIPANGSVAYPIGTVITIDNDTGAGILTIAITADTLVLVGAAGTTGSRTLASGGKAAAQKVASTRWRISGSAELT